MIKLKISLLLAFNLNFSGDEPKKKSKSKGGKRSKSSSKSSKKTKKSSKGSKMSKRSKKNKDNKKRSGKEKTHKEEPELKDYEFKIDKPLGYVHIDYNLLPGYKYKVDVVCWGPIAKVYTVDGQTSFKTIIKDGNAWVPVFLEHSRNPFQTNEIETYKDYIISFSLNAGKEKVAGKARNDKTKMFYIKEEDVASENFVQAYDVNPNLHDVSEKGKQALLEFVRNLILKTTNSPNNMEIDTWVHNQDKVHSYNMLDAIKRIANGDGIDCREYVPELPQNKKPKKDKKPKKETGGSKKEKKDKKPTSMNIKIPAKLLYTDPTLVTYRLATSIPAINHAFFFLSSQHLMSVEQKMYLEPFVMKVLKISNFPCDVLKQNGFDNVYVRCEIPNIISFKTPIQPVAETIKVRESQIVFTRDKSKRKTFEYFHTQKIQLQIYGVKTEPLKAEKPEGVFTHRSASRSPKASNNEEKSKKSKSSHSSKSKSKKSSETSSKKSKNDDNDSKDTLLALAMFDASSLLKNVWMFKEKGQCHNPNILVAQKGIELAKFIDRYTVQEGNMIVREIIPSPLKEELLLRLGTTIKLEAFFLAPQYPSSSILSTTFKRLLLIMFDVNSAKSLLNLIFLHNQSLTRMESFVPNPIIKYVEGRQTEKFDQDLPVSINSHGTSYDGIKDVITGFFIDSDMGNFIIYVEGQSNGYILNIFHQVHYLNPSKAKVFYSSDYMFENRLFPMCTLLMYNVVFKIPLQDMWERPEVYIEGNVPLAGWRAILKLYLICATQLFKSILQSYLLPTEQEIACLGDQFGVAYRYMSDIPMQHRRNTLMTLQADHLTELQLLREFIQN